jgi:hypothetical protein
MLESLEFMNLVKSMNDSKNKILGDDFGLVFELGVNVGILAGIRHLVSKNKLVSKVHALYDDELKQMKLSRVVSRLLDKAIRFGVTDPTLLKKTATFLEYLVFLGVHKGFNFIVEYCEGMPAVIKGFRSEPLSIQSFGTSLNSLQTGELSGLSQKADEPTLLYYQCDLQQLFYADSYVRYESLIPKLDKMFKRLESTIKPDYQRFQHRGQFLNADIIMLFQLFDRYRVVVIDVGLFSVADMSFVPDLHDVPTVKQRLLSTYHYMRQKTAFEHLNIDSDKAGIHYSPELADYFEAFSRNDKDTEKMIQAGGYAYSFVQCLSALLPARFNDKNLEVNAIGLTDRAFNATFIADKADMPILQLFQKIYQDSKKAQRNGMPYSDRRALSVQSVFNTIYSNFKRTFRRARAFNGEANSCRDEHKAESLAAFVEKLQTLPVSDNEVKQVAYTETLKDFHSTADEVPTALLAEVGLLNQTESVPLRALNQTESVRLRDSLCQISFRNAHAMLIKKAMYNNDLLVFLTGHPGIGKTTAIVEYLLSAEILSEGVLFFYFSPRTQVNYDIVEKLSDIKDGKRVVKSDSVVCIYSNSALITRFEGQPVIKYASNMRLPSELKMPSAIGGKKSVLRLVADAEEVQFRKSRFSHSQSSSDNKMEYSSSIAQGVLNTVCSAICTLRQAHRFNNSIPKNIIATATVQSLKKTQMGNTAQHLKRMFAEAANDKQLKYFDEAKLAQIAKTTRHLIFMVDEVIGDSGGAELLHELVKISKRLKLDKHFKLKIIASDASIAGKDVIRQHLSKPTPSPAKILYRQVVDKTSEAKPLSIQQAQVKMGFYKLDATLINANSFPAGELVLSYKVGVEMAAIDGKGDTITSSESMAQSLAWILRDIFKLLGDKSRNGQIIVYIQNIKRLNQLINALKSKILPNPFLKGDNELSAFEEFQDYLQIHSSISDETRQKIHQHKNTVKVIFMTSSASRGITFARVRHILIEVPKFQIENNLMEIVQTVYRGRGGETDEERALEKQTRWITFYLHDSIRYADRAQRAERYQRGISGLMNMILLVRAALKTRIAGYGDIGRKRELRIIPVGGKHIDSVGASLLTSAAQLLTEMRREIRRSYDDAKAGQADYDNSLAKLRQDVRTIFVRTQTRVANETLKKLDTYYESFAQRAQQSLYDVLTHDFESEFYIDGDIFTVPIASSEERVDIPRDMLRAAKAERLVERMQGHAANYNYTNNLRIALTKMAKEIEKMQQASDETHRSQDVYSQNTSGGQYLSIPLPVFFKPQIFRQYFRHNSETQSYEAETVAGDSFRDALGNYLYLLYQLVGKLPLDGGYESFPFLLFRCENLTVIRQQRFDRRYLFSSTAFNLINLVLSQTEQL